MPKPLTQEQFIEKARNVHGDKYDYSKSKYLNSETKVCIICPKHGEFWQTPLVHLYGNGCGCKECRKEFLREKFKSSEQEFIEKAKSVHGDKYDYSEVKYVNSHVPVTIICPEHGKFEQAPYSHLNGRGCYKCGRIKSGEKAAARNVLQTSEFIEKAKEVHGDRYDYTKVNYVNNQEKVCIICPEHGEFMQAPQVHLRGSGCPSCKESSLEREIYDFLKGKNVSFEREKTFDWLVFKGKMFLDFYLPEQKMAIECQGVQHFIPVDFSSKMTEFEKINKFSEIKKRDAAKKALCEEHGITLKYFFHSTYFVDHKIYTKDNVIKNTNDLRLQ